MRRAFRLVAALSVVTAVAVAPTAASAKTKTVWAGSPPAATGIEKTLLGKPFINKYNPDVDDFFLHRVTINVGDAVTFKNAGFHTIDLPGSTGADLPLFTPGALVTGVKDAAGVPFWFNGKVPTLGFNPLLHGPLGATPYDGTKRIDTGLPLGKAKPLKVTFTKAGTFKYFCDVHPGMVGFVVVKPKGKTVPSAAQDAAALTSQITNDVLASKKLANKKPGKNKVSLGEAGKNGVELFQMFPAKLKVKAGTVVTFAMSPTSFDIHSASFGPKAYLTALNKSLKSPSIAQQALYRSDPLSPIPLGPTTHGNGFANTGVLDNDKTGPLLASSKIKFTTKGTYKYVCIIHPFMKGTVTVT
jgi:plastocyanin